MPLRTRTGLLAGLFFAIATSLHAQDRAGTTFLSAGFASMRAADSDTRITAFVTPSPGTLALGIPESFEMPGVEVIPQPAHTMAISVGHFFTDRWLVSLDVGIPPRIAVEGRGVAAPPGASGATFNLDVSDPALNPLGTQRQWSPAVTLQYRFGQPGTFFRPFAGAGVSYTWFTDAALNPAFAAALDERFGQPLANGAGKPGPTTSEIRIEPLWTWSLTTGAHFALGKRWGLGTAIVYSPFTVESELTMRAEDRSTLARSEIEVDVSGFIGTVTLDYRIGE